MGTEKMESGEAYERGEEKTKPGQATKERKQQKHPEKGTSFLLSWFSPLPRGSNPDWNLQALHDALTQSSLQRVAQALPKNVTKGSRIAPFYEDHRSTKHLFKLAFA